MLGKLFVLTRRFAWVVLAFAVVLGGIGLYITPGFVSRLGSGGFMPPEAESTKVSQQLREQFTKDQPEVIIIVDATEGDVSAPSYVAALKDLTTQIGRQAGVKNVQTYVTTGLDTFVSKDRRSSFALVSVEGDLAAQEKTAAAIRDSVHNNDVKLAYGGAAILNHDITKQIGRDLAQAEVISFAVLAILLVLVFRGVVAALLPLVLGGFSIVVALLSLVVLVQFANIVEYALNVIILIGLGLAVDYSLLMVSRFREELLHFKGDVDAALQVTLHTAGRTIFFSGLTVVISLLALVVFPLDFLKSMGLGGAAAVTVSMLSALIVLPALLKLLGRRINWLSFGRVRTLEKTLDGEVAGVERQSIWQTAGQFFMKQPVITIMVTLVVLVGAGTPFLHARLTAPDHSVLPPDSIARQVTDRLHTDFDFNDSPIKVVYTTDYVSATDPQAIAALAAYSDQLRNLPNVEKVLSIADVPAERRASTEGLVAGQSAQVTVSFTSETMSTDTQQLVRDVRAQPAPHAQVKVGGETAELVDLLSTLATYIPIAAAIIGVTLFILLFLMLGSVVIPLNAIVQNVLSLGASFGALVLLFQEKHFADLLHLNATGNIDATQPVLIFAAAFGLSMDYAVFLYSRIKEEYDHTGDNNKAVLGGLQKTGPIITSAAMLLFVVVVAFATSRISIMQQIGVGLALAILVDAFVVRMVLVPATMRLFGRYNWWAPAFLKKLHRRIGLDD